MKSQLFELDCLGQKGIGKQMTDAFLVLASVLIAMGIVVWWDSRL